MVVEKSAASAALALKWPPRKIRSWREPVSAVFSWAAVHDVAGGSPSGWMRVSLVVPAPVPIPALRSSSTASAALVMKSYPVTRDDFGVGTTPPVRREYACRRPSISPGVFTSRPTGRSGTGNSWPLMLSTFFEP